VKEVEMEENSPIKTFHIQIHELVFMQKCLTLEWKVENNPNKY